MPIYEYLCQTCNEKFELIRQMKDADSPTQCPNCGGQAARRQVSLVNAHSGGKVLAGNSSGCASCSSTSCSSCGVH